MIDIARPGFRPPEARPRPKPEIKQDQQKPGIKERASALLDKVRKWLPFWKELKDQPEKIVAQIAHADTDLPDEPNELPDAIAEVQRKSAPIHPGEKENSIPGEEPLNREVVYDEKGFATETSPDNEPSYNWREYLAQELRFNGITNPDTTNQRWESLHPSMREQLILTRYLKSVEIYALQKDQESWKYIASQAKGFTVEKTSRFARVNEGSDFIGVNASVLMADVKSGDPKRLAAAFTRLVHEAQHIELNKLINGADSVSEGVNPILAEKSYRGYMTREELCWQREAALYRKLTGEEPAQKWEDLDIQEWYERDYSRYKQQNFAENYTEEHGNEERPKEIALEDLPENLRGLAPFMLGDSPMIKEARRQNGEREFIFSYKLQDPENLFPNQKLQTDVTVREKDVSPRSLGKVSIKLTVGSGEPIDLSTLRNQDSHVEIRWAGGTGGVRKDRVSVDEKGIPQIGLDRLTTGFDIVAYLHEASHTHQPAKLIAAADIEADLRTKVFYSEAMEADAWVNTDNLMAKAGLTPNSEVYNLLRASFQDDYAAAYKTAISQGYTPREKPPSIREAMVVLLTRKLRSLLESKDINATAGQQVMA